MIDLAKLEDVANRPGKEARVSRSFLRQVHAELAEARQARRPCGTCFGLPGGKPI